MHSDMFADWPSRLTQSDPYKQKYAIICYIYNVMTHADMLERLFSICFQRF